MRLAVEEKEIYFMINLKDIVMKRTFIGQENNFDKNNLVHIAFGIDCNFTLGMGILINSIILNNQGKNFCFHIFTDAIKSEDLKKLNNLVDVDHNIAIKIYFLDKDKLKALPVGFTWTYAIYYRFIICEELYGNVDKVLYLDSDILCVNPIDNLLSYEFGNFVIAAVEDISDIKEHADRLFNGDEVRYFSSGVMYICVEKWKKQNITEKAIDLLTKKNNYKFFDQDVLNQLLRGKVDFWDKKYNYIYNLYGMNHDVPKDIVFIHFAGTTKPWQRWAQWHFLYQEYLEYKKKSPWKDTSVEEPTTYKQAKFMARAYKKNKQYGKAIVWYIKYSLKKIKGKLFR